MYLIAQIASSMAELCVVAYLIFVAVAVPTVLFEWGPHGRQPHQATASEPQPGLQTRSRGLGRPHDAARRPAWVAALALLCLLPGLIAIAVV